MSRKPRFTYAHAVHHVTLRCNNKEFLFAVPSFELFLEVLQQARQKFPLALLNYCLMTNHVHLLIKVGKDDTLSRAMHWISSRFSRRFNALAVRRGHIWEGRFRSTLIEEDSYFFRCMAYIDLNPVRAKMAVTPIEYRWSGHRALRDENGGVLDLHQLYLDGGKTATERYAAYMKLVEEEAARPAIPLATEYIVGSARFAAKMRERFGIGGSSDALEVKELGGVCVVGPAWGGNRRRNANDSHNR